MSRRAPTVCFPAPRSADHFEFVSGLLRGAVLELHAVVACRQVSCGDDDARQSELLVGREGQRGDLAIGAFQLRLYGLGIQSGSIDAERNDAVVTIDVNLWRGARCAARAHELQLRENRARGG